MPHQATSCLIDEMLPRQNSKTKPTPPSIHSAQHNPSSNTSWAWPPSGQERRVATVSNVAAGGGTYPRRTVRSNHCAQIGDSGISLPSLNDPTEVWI